MPSITIREWDTLTLTCKYVDDEGLPINLNGFCIGCEIKIFYSGKPIMLDITVIDALSGQFIISKPNLKLIPANYIVDIMFKDIVDNSIISSDTFEIQVVPAITSPEALVCPNL